MCKSYRTDRKQKVLLNDTELDVGCLYAGVPHGSVLGPMQFLIYIKDISDHTYGSCRLQCQRSLIFKCRQHTMVYFN
jgi:hypothetical protein